MVSSSTVASTVESNSMVLESLRQKKIERKVRKKNRRKLIKCEEHHYIIDKEVAEMIGKAIGEIFQNVMEEMSKFVMEETEKQFQAHLKDLTERNKMLPRSVLAVSKQSHGIFCPGIFCNACITAYLLALGASLAGAEDLQLTGISKIEIFYSK